MTWLKIFFANNLLLRSVSVKSRIAQQSTLLKDNCGEPSVVKKVYAICLKIGSNVNACKSGKANW